MEADKPVGDEQISRRTFTKAAIGAGVGVVAASAAAVRFWGDSPEAKHAVITPTPTGSPAPSGTPTPQPVTSATNVAFNRQVGWTVPDTWGASWRAKLNAAKAGTGVAIAAIVGDSISYGYWSSDLTSTSWAELLRASLISVGGHGGSGFQGHVHSPSVMYNPKSGVPQHYRSVPANVWQQSDEWQPLIPPYVYGPGLGAMMAMKAGATLSNSFVGDKLGLWYYDSGPAFTVQIDSKAVGTITPKGTNAPLHVSFPVPGGVAGKHTWTIKGGVLPATGIGTAVCGVEGLAGHGVRLDNFAFPGLYSRLVANNDKSYHTGTFLGGWQNPSDLLIYEVLGNDIIGADPQNPKGVPVETWASNVQAFLDGVTKSTYGGDGIVRTDVLLMLPMFRLSSDQQKLFQQYKARALEIARTYGAAVLDVSAAYGQGWDMWQKAGYAGNQTDPTKPGSDSIHPCDAGHAYVAKTITPLLTALE